MKKVLLSTTALVAAGLLVTSVAYAGDEEMMEEEMMAGPVSASVGGYYRVAFGGYSGDGDDGKRGHYIDQNIEINVAGSTTLDNGITAGVNIWLDAMNGNNTWGDDISETRLYLSGTFGTLTLGSFESAAQLGTIWAPGGNGNFGIKSPFFGVGKRPSWQSAVAGASEDSFKISYDSPSFNGISLSASYEPDDNQASYGGRGAEDAGQISEVTSISLGFTQDVMGGSASAGIGIENGTHEMCAANCDASSIRGGLVISVDQISIGGAVLETENLGASTTHTDVGIGWSQGPLGLGVQYGSRDESGGGSEVTAINAAYDLGPGVQINSQLAMGSAGDSDFSEFLLGTTISF